MLNLDANCRNRARCEKCSRAIPLQIFSSGKFTLFLGKLLRDVVLILLIQEISPFLIIARLLNIQMK